MYGLKWPFLLMYGSHDMRHTGIPQVDRLSTGPPGIGASQLLISSFAPDELDHLCIPLSMGRKTFF